MEKMMEWLENYKLALTWKNKHHKTQAEK